MFILDAHVDVPLKPHVAGVQVFESHMCNLRALQLERPFASFSYQGYSIRCVHRSTGRCAR